MPEPIRAVDADDINNPVTYSFVSGTRADYAHYFSIDERTGVVTQTAPISRGDTDKVILLVQAQEMTSGVAIPGRFSVATLTVHVTAVNSHDPVLELTGRVGFVEENAPVGTVVRTDRDESAPGMRITAYDPDLP
ncbi:PREDICTED: protocadherin-like wing polarity protein stan [Priapulus caudatus]|uniref:Protocadherin-like wing polarity protein stan n=1 Tax=Priapulus caudatus TaxID=37621 RepID=A0ABM1F062_PRICU|nr:PREDICTED: protocadherin-like wing polarity protein stan [Priapulus caudatus]